MNLLPVISTIAIVLGLAGVLPHIVAMLSRRSAAGQSSLGWTLGVAVNALMAYVNAAGYGALALAIGNVVGGLLCAVALVCTMRLPRAIAPPAAARPDPLDLSTGDLSEMLEALAGERERRERARHEQAEHAGGERELAAA